MLADLWPDLRFGARMLLKQPDRTLITVLTRAVDIGANTAIFSVVNALFLLVVLRAVRRRCKLSSGFRSGNDV